MTKKTHTINIEEDIINKFKEEAQKQNKPYSGALEEALKLWLDKMDLQKNINTPEE